MSKVSLGLDTSCYSTSCAIMDDDQILADERTMLLVKEGTRGLRQSDALFMHIKNMPKLIESSFEKLGGKSVDIVCASEFPRRAENSYMPVFSASKSFGQSLSSALNADYYAASHQEVHIAAGIFSSKNSDFLKEDFLALHLSGGTTELLFVQPEISSKCAFKVEVIGGSEDLNAGQFIDRVGVALGLSFPAGEKLDKLSKTCEDSEAPLSFSVSTRKTYLSFSGPESQAMRIIEKGEHKNEQIAKATFVAITAAVNNILTHSLNETKVKNILVVGGVASNTYLREQLSKKISLLNNGSHKIFFASPTLSRDNAVGAAYIGQLMLKGAR